MPTAICNTCHHLVVFKGCMSRQKCSCGSKDISQVKGKLNDRDNSWEYKDRKGEIRLVVPRGVVGQTVSHYL